MVDRGARARLGAKPAGVLSRSTSLTGVISAVDVPDNTISIVGQGGGAVHVLEVHNPERQAYLPKIAPGSLLTITYTSTAVLDVTSPAK